MNQPLNRTELKYYISVTGGFADQYRRDIERMIQRLDYGEDAIDFEIYDEMEYRQDDDNIVNTFTLSVLMLGTSKEQEDTLKQLMTGRYQARLVHEQRFDR